MVAIQVQRTIKNIMIYIRFILCSVLVSLSGCNYLPEIAKDIDDIATDCAIKVEIDKAAMQKDTNVNINVGVTNSELKAP
jgi:hypothetical protein